MPPIYTQTQKQTKNLLEKPDILKNGYVSLAYGFSDEEKQTKTMENPMKNTN